VLVAVVLAGAVAAAGIRLMGPSDGPITVGEIATPAAARTPGSPATVPAATVPSATASGTTASTGPAAATIGGAPTAAPGALPTIPWPTSADGSVREPFALPTAPEATEPAAVAADDAEVVAASDGVATVTVPTVTGYPVATIGAGGTAAGGDADGTDGSDGLDDADGTATSTVPEETMTTRSPTLGLVVRSAGGYWLFQSDGSVYASRPDTWFGDLRAVPLTSPVVGMQATPTGAGYYLVSRDGGVFAFGDAIYDGSIPETLARQLESLLDDGYLAPTTTTTAPKHR
jgi:hypothetical protein